MRLFSEILSFPPGFNRVNEGPFERPNRFNGFGTFE